MAIFLPGPAVAEIRGSSGGTTFSRNRFGQYTRQRSKPVNPNSPSQVTARDRFNTLATRWRDVLTAAQRAGWDAYAAGTNWVNALGQIVNLTGLNHYVRSNLGRLVVAAAPTDVAPVVMGIPDQEADWTHTADATTQQVELAYTFDVSTDDQDYLFYQGVPVDASRNFFAGPWRYLGAVEGDSTSPPTSPATFDSVYSIGEGQKCFVYCRRIDADARLTQPFRASCVVAAS